MHTHTTVNEDFQIAIFPPIYSKYMKCLQPTRVYDTTLTLLVRGNGMGQYNEIWTIFDKHYI